MNSDLMRRVAFTLGALLVYRIGTFIPLPGIDISVWERLFPSQSGGILGMANFFSGGAVGRLAIFALQLIPYTTAAILVQLVLLFSPRLRALRERGEQGRRTIQYYTLGLTLLLAMFQAYGIAVGLEGADVAAEPGLLFRISTVVTLAGGTFFLIWLSELITVRGVGNGLALILFIGIVTQVPVYIREIFQLGQSGVFSISLILGLAIIALALVALIVVMEMARRNVPVEYERRQIGDRIIERRSSTLSFKLNGAGTVPFILAGQLLSLVLVAIYSALGRFDPELASSLFERLIPGQSIHMIYVGVAIIVFALLYVALLVDPDQVAEKLKSYGGTVSGIGSGAPTADHIDHVLSHITILGGAYLAIVCLVPEILIAYAHVPFYLGGVSALVVVCTVLDLGDQVQSRELIKKLEERHP
jgi:preprotein translocase subunit SecY